MQLFRQPKLTELQIFFILTLPPPGLSVSSVIHIVLFSVPLAIYYYVVLCNLFLLEHRVSYFTDPVSLHPVPQNASSLIIFLSYNSYSYDFNFFKSSFSACFLSDSC